MLALRWCQMPQSYSTCPKPSERQLATLHLPWNIWVVSCAIQQCLAWRLVWYDTYEWMSTKHAKHLACEAGHDIQSWQNFTTTTTCTMIVLTSWLAWAFYFPIVGTCFGVHPWYTSSWLPLRRNKWWCLPSVRSKSNGSWHILWAANKQQITWPRPSLNVYSLGAITSACMHVLNYMKQAEQFKEQCNT